MKILKNLFKRAEDDQQSNKNSINEENSSLQKFKVYKKRFNKYSVPIMSVDERGIQIDWENLVDELDTDNIIKFFEYMDITTFDNLNFEKLVQFAYALNRKGRNDSYQALVDYVLTTSKINKFAIHLHLKNITKLINEPWGSDQQNRVLVKNTKDNYIKLLEVLEAISSPQGPKCVALLWLTVCEAFLDNIDKAKEIFAKIDPTVLSSDDRGLYSSVQNQLQ